MLTIQNHKTIKGEKLGYLTAILYLAPHKTVEGINTCPAASKGCSEACLYTAGRGRYSSVQQARIRKTELLRDHPQLFMAELFASINKMRRLAARKGMQLAVRLNGTSDIAWEAKKLDGLTVFDAFKDVQFYDYTKIAARMTRKLPANYHLTFSRSEENESTCLKILAQGSNVAMVFDRLPKSYRGFEVISGDEHDLRFLDKKGVIVGLIPKHKAKLDTTGFTINTLESSNLDLNLAA